MCGCAPEPRHCSNKLSRDRRNHHILVFGIFGCVHFSGSGKILFHGGTPGNAKVGVNVEVLFLLSQQYFRMFGKLIMLTSFFYCKKVKRLCIFCNCSFILHCKSFFLHLSPVRLSIDFILIYYIIKFFLYQIKTLYHIIPGKENKSSIVMASANLYLCTSTWLH